MLIFLILVPITFIQTLQKYGLLKTILDKSKDKFKKDLEESVNKIKNTIKKLKISMVIIIKF